MPYQTRLSGLEWPIVLIFQPKSLTSSRHDDSRDCQGHG